MEAIEIRPVQAVDRPWLVSFLREEWGSDIIVTRGKVHSAQELSGLMATIASVKAGLVTYTFVNGECEIVSLNSMVTGKGVGTKLIEAMLMLAKRENCKRVWLITTNDNIDALRFYQKRGFGLAALYPNAIEQSRKIKPQIGLTGNHGIPIRDEIELEILL